MVCARCGNKIDLSDLVKAEEKLYILEKLIEDWLPQIGMTITFREMFYEVLGKPNPEWLGERQLTNNELRWIYEHMSLSSPEILVEEKES